MYTRSIIKQIKDTLEVKENFNEGLSALMDKYNVEDSIFVIKEGSVKEAVSGYFVISKEFDNLIDAIRECDVRSMGIRIIQNEKFQTGAIYQNLSQCPKEGQIYDITSLENVR